MIKKKKITYAKILPQMVNPRDLPGNAEEEEEEEEEEDEEEEDEEEEEEEGEEEEEEEEEEDEERWQSIGYLPVVCRYEAVQEATGPATVYSQGARRTYRASPSPPPPPTPQEPSTMVPKCTLGCPEYSLTCSPDSHWDALEL